MADLRIQTSDIKRYQAEVYQKTSDIFTVIQSHAEKGCVHCLSILKIGLREPTPNPADADDSNHQVSNLNGNYTR